MFHRKVWRSDPAQKLQTTLRVEELEARIVPYNVTGNAWPNPQLITISFVPDGTLIGYNQNGPIYSTLFADFNGKFGSPATWEKQILLAANSWAGATNINFSVVSDDGVQFGQISGDDEQGDPNIGDIRIAGFQDTGAGYLAQAFQPPPANDYSLAGDIWFNTSQNFWIGTTYDLFTVAAHEIGHALGMDESGDSSAVMAPIYPGTMTGLTSDDSSGIESIYSGGLPRSYDAYNDGSTHNNSFANSAAVTVDSGTLTAQLTNLDITKPTMVEYFKFVAPTGSKTLDLSIQSSGLSLLAHRAWVYNSAKTQIAYQSGIGNYGDTLNVSVGTIVAGRTYYIKVAGADNTALGTGLYDLSMTLGSNPLPSVTLPNTTTPNGNPITTGNSMPEDDADQYTGTTPSAPITMPTPTMPTPYMLTMLEMGTMPPATAEEWAIHVLDRGVTNPQIKALAEHVVKVVKAEEAHDPALRQELATGKIPSVVPPRIS